MKHIMNKNINKTKVYLSGLVLTTSLGFVQYIVASNNNVTKNSSERSKLALGTAVAYVKQCLP